MYGKHFTDWASILQTLFSIFQWTLICPRNVRMIACSRVKAIHAHSRSTHRTLSWAASLLSLSMDRKWIHTQDLKPVSRSSWRKGVIEPHVYLLENLQTLNTKRVELKVILESIYSTSFRTGSLMKACQCGPVVLNDMLWASKWIKRTWHINLAWGWFCYTPVFSVFFLPFLKCYCKIVLGSYGLFIMHCL